MTTLAFIANLTGLGAVMIASLIKGNKITKTLILLWLGNFLVSAGYILSGTGIAGAASGMLACVQISINYFFERKNRPVPLWLIGIYMLCFAAMNLAIEGIAVSTALATLACFAFVISILQKSGKNYRICGIVNTILWSTYDIITHSFNALLTHGTLLAVNIFGFVIHDIRKKKD